MKKMDFKKMALMGITGALTVVAQGAVAASGAPSTPVTLAGGGCSSCRTIAARDYTSPQGEMDEGSLEEQQGQGTQMQQQGQQGQMRGQQGSCAGVQRSNGGGTTMQPQSGCGATQRSGGSCAGTPIPQGQYQNQGRTSNYPSNYPSSPQSYYPDNSAKRSDLYSR
jgi:hypothetical protein